MLQPSRPDRALSAIDLLRFACAAMVVGYHYGFAFPLTPPRPLAGVVAAPVNGLWFGWVGVELFFVISGYVILATAERLDARQFVRARVLRLVPAVWICATTTALLLLTVPGVDIGSVAHGWVDAVAFLPIGVQIDGSYWTLAIEIAFYALITTSLALGGGERALWKVVLYLGAISLDYWMMQAAFAHDPAFPTRARMLTLMPHGVFFALGAVLYRLSTKSWSWQLAGFSLALAWGCCFEIVVRATTVERDYHLTIGPHLPIAVFLAGVVVVALAVRLQPVMAWTVSSRHAARIGMATYPLYLVHQAAGAVVIAWLTAAGAPYYLASMVVGALSLGFALWCAALPEPWLRERLTRVRLLRAPAPGRSRIAFLRGG
ncbi:acyltransferase [uncultured Sphingomonas sp.]|uniref:acyltransferase family protein n=1 Tax=uncultured Sphingomonas sp. TaxID=158754 RepID=UPI0025FD5C97|nr:acyltransferase [uncultured Sphingomonas sp.]